jgi:hypothetical protein
MENPNFGDQVVRDCADYRNLKTAARHFKEICHLAGANGPKAEIQITAKAALATVEKIGDYISSITLQAIAERMVQIAEEYDPDVAEKRDPVNDLGMATWLLIDHSLKEMVGENNAKRVMAAA